MGKLIDKYGIPAIRKGLKKINVSDARIDKLLGKADVGNTQIAEREQKPILALPEGEKPLLLPPGKGKVPARITPGSLPIDEEAAVLATINNIDSNTIPNNKLSKKWGSTFGNYNNDLPVETHGTYKEYRVQPEAGASGAGSRRVVVNTRTKDVYYTWTHYGDNGDPAFVQIR
jgi:hypothetical protein